MTTAICPAPTCWTGEPARRVCLCVPSAVRHRADEINDLEDALAALFGLTANNISRRYSGEVLITVYTARDDAPPGHKGNANDCAQLWGLQKTRSLWQPLQSEADWLREVK